MVIIKIYSQDMYVASEISIHHSEALAKVLGIEPTDLFFVGSEGTLVAEGVDQVSWFTYLEISMAESLRPLQQTLSNHLYQIFTNYGVHLMIKFEYFTDREVVKILNPDFKIFNQTLVEVEPTPYHSHDEDDNELADFFGPDDDDDHFH